MVEQAEILEHDADAAAQRRRPRPSISVATSWPNRVIRPRVGLQRQEQQAQQRGLAGAGGAGEELEGMRLDAEGEVAQDLRPQAVAQADILESDHAPLR